MVVKIDSLGSVDWTYKIEHGPNYYFDAGALQQVSDSGFAIIGSKVFLRHSDRDSALIYLEKISKGGEFVWMKEYSYKNPDDTTSTLERCYGIDIEYLPDNGFYILGYADPVGNNSAVFLSKINTDYDLEWEKGYFFNQLYLYPNFLCVGDTTLLIGGWHDIFGTTYPSLSFLLSTNLSGDSISNWSFGYNSKVFSMQHLDQENYLIGIISHELYTNEIVDFYTFVYGNYNNHIDYTPITNSVSGTEIRSIEGGYNILAGNQCDTNSVCEIYLNKVDTAGTLFWEKMYGIEGRRNICWSMEPTYDGGFVMAGFTENLEHGNRNIYIIKTDQKGNFTWYTEYPLGKSINVRTCPNPFTTSTSLSYELKQPEKVTLSVYNHLGQLIYQIAENQPQGNQQLRWNAVNVADGVYYYRLKAGDVVANGKLVKVK